MSASQLKLQDSNGVEQTLSGDDLRKVLAGNSELKFPNPVPARGDVVMKNNTPYGIADGEVFTMGSSSIAKFNVEFTLNLDKEIVPIPAAYWDGTDSDVLPANALRWFNHDKTIVMCKHPLRKVWMVFDRGDETGNGGWLMQEELQEDKPTPFTFDAWLRRNGDINENGSEEHYGFDPVKEGQMFMPSTAEEGDSLFLIDTWGTGAVMPWNIINTGAMVNLSRDHIHVDRPGAMYELLYSETYGWKITSTDDKGPSYNMGTQQGALNVMSKANHQPMKSHVNVVMCHGEFQLPGGQGDCEMTVRVDPIVNLKTGDVAFLPPAGEYLIYDEEQWSRAIVAKISVEYRFLRLNGVWYL